MVKIVSILVGVLIVAGGAIWAIVAFNAEDPKKPIQSAKIVSSKKEKSQDERRKARLESLKRFAERTNDPDEREASTNRDNDVQFSRFDPDKSYEDGEVVVVDPPANFANEVQSMGFGVLERLSFADLDMNVYRLRVPSGQSVQGARRTLLGRFPALLVDANHQFDNTQGSERKTRRRTTSSGGALDQIKKKRAKKAVGSRAQAAIGWKNVAPTCGNGVVIGMIDSGVDLKHPALAGQDIEFKSFHSKKRRPGPKVHGTAVAALLVGKPSPKGWGGLLPGAQLKAANMFELNKIGKKVGNVIALLKSLNWLAQQGVHVVNLSIAGSKNRAVNKGFQAARKKGLVMVAAAVTAIGPYNGIYKKANRGSYVEFAAPGVRMWTAVPGGGKYQSGTSFAAPFISALFGLAIANGSKKDPNTLRSIIKTGVADLGQPGRDKTFGWGRINKQPNC